MAKHHDRHLAAEQLSALLDKQLSTEEQAVCEAHLQSCQQCQNALLGLRQTVAFLQALPQPELPRSFVLPTAVTYLQDRSEGEPPLKSHHAERQRSRFPTLQRATRIVSTIAAVIGLFFLLSTVLSISHLSGGAATSTSSANPVSAPYTSTSGNVHSTPIPTVKGVAPHQQATSPTVGQTKTPAIVPHLSQGQEHQPSSLTLPDINTSWGRQEIGFILLALGIIGFLLSRRWGPKQRRE